MSCRASPRCSSRLRDRAVAAAARRTRSATSGRWTPAARRPSRSRRSTGRAAAAELANDETSGLAAGIVTEDRGRGREFLGAYARHRRFWNATTRLLDGFKLLAVPETGINIDRVPGPRGPVTFRDLYLRQYVVQPA